jgi:hypothetical protein
MARPPGIVEKKRRNIDPQVAHERAVKARAAQNTPENAVSCLERARERLLADPVLVERVRALLASAPKTEGGQS